MTHPTMPDLRQLRYFVAVAEEQHFGRAAARLSMTQPPLSQAIRALEETLGVELFARTRRSVELTPVGADLLPEVRRLLAAAETLRPLAQSLARGEAGTLALSFVSTADYGLLPLLLRDFGARYPRVRLQLAEVPLVVFPRQLAPGFYDAIMDCCGAAALAPRVGQEAIQMQTIVSLVSAGMGIALVPRSLRHLRRTGVAYRPLAGDQRSIETGLVWRRSEVSPVLAAFIDIVRAHSVKLEAPPHV